MSLFLPLQRSQFRLVSCTLVGMYSTSRILENKKFIQHGTTTLYSHCRNVAMVSLKLSNVFHWKVDRESLVRGALLHDYYLYDWHDKSARLKLHGYFHPALALKNAREIYDLSFIEEDIIAHHMFPLTIHPPVTKEGWLVSIADKLCSLYETFKLNERRIRKRRMRLENK